ncbi:hypothetical protein [Bradyrhizobium liaoningense]|uniref:hypothetical protein n=1 Tax=Bradyrhizobium liaoningense TaxID=43992 RepID=UPI001BA45ED1|nr:hypothetical protein [Bradyrhizobium liaoningense]MBR0818377.1 hypothetical protein [Bradyrhizobium liaoningense]
MNDVTVVRSHRISAPVNATVRARSTPVIANGMPGAPTDGSYSGALMHQMDKGANFDGLPRNRA